jgi:hypothetical protein
MTDTTTLDKEHSICLTFFNKIRSIEHKQELIDFVLSIRDKPAKSLSNAVSLLEGPEKPVEDKYAKKINKAKALLQKHAHQAKTNSNIPAGLNYSLPLQDADAVDKFIKHKLLLVKKAKFDTLKLHIEIAEALSKLKPTFGNQKHFFLHIQSSFGISRR